MEALDAGSNTSSANSMPVIDMTVAELLSSMDQLLEESEYPNLSDCKSEEGTMELEGGNECNTTTYYLGEKTQMAILSSTDDNKIIQIIFFSTNDLAYWDEIKMAFYCEGVLLGILDGDQGDRIQEELKLDNITADQITTAEGDVAGYRYIVDKGRLTFLIAPSESF